MRQQSNKAEIQQAIQDAREAVRAAAEQARATADQARASADQARAAADQARATTGADAQAPAAPSGSRPIIITQDGDNPVSIDMRNGNLVISQDGNTKVIPWRDAVPSGAVQIAWAIPATLSILVIWWPLTRALVGRMRRKNAVAQDTAALEARWQERFDAMERNVDTVAIEIEKLAEGQRFTNRLIAERQTGVPPVPSPMQVPVNVPQNVPVGAPRP